MHRALNLGIAVLCAGLFIKATQSNVFFANQAKETNIKVREGFEVQHLFSPSEVGLGSWVAMTFDNKGRLIASDQYGGLYRMEIHSKGQFPEVEKLKIEGDTLEIGAAQGLLWAFNSLFMVVNNHPSEKMSRKSGLYRLDDADKDGNFDKITLLKELVGEGEHGPHSIILSPDGKSLFMIAGNHTDLPEMDAYILPKVWKNDNLFPYFTDPRGHAADRKEPGGWIAKINPENNSWEMISGGFRNAFDIAFNEAGDLFAYDADMEWDFGLPWYRPTRICHVTSGSEWGWRTGSAKWSTYFSDNLPPVINIGQGSPTSLVSLKNARFPEEYRNNLLAFDWSFGIVHTIKLRADKSTYSAEREEFLSGIPLPLTDGVIGPDGALYFLTGGRGLQSDLYKVNYTKNDIKPTERVSSNQANELRRKLESYHTKNPEAVEFAWPYLDNEDRFIQYAARIAVEHQPLVAWKQKALSETNPEKAAMALMALIRQGNAASKAEIYTALSKLDFTKLNSTNKLVLLRDYELLFARFGQPDQANRLKFLNSFESKFPTVNEDVNRQLVKLLVFLQSPNIVGKAISLIEKEDKEKQSEMATSSEDLILRNPAYGLDIAKMLEKVPPARQTYYAFVLSQLKSGWTPALRTRYFKWFNSALDKKGGLSYVGFINNARTQALGNLTEKERPYYDKLSGAEKLGSNGVDITDISHPKGPGRSWKMEEAEPLFNSKLVARDFDNGRNMYNATLCNRCHAIQGEGGNIGPDLSQLATRFSVKDILEAIIEPNNSISDQYSAIQIQLKNGETVVGRIVQENDEYLLVSQNPFVPDVTQKINIAEVTTRSPSTVSIMLPGLVNSLNEEELKDLMAFLLAGGNKDNPIFKQ